MSHDQESIRKIIEKTSNQGSDMYSNSKNAPNQQLMTTNFLKNSGILEAYESVVTNMIEDGWPSETSIFDHAAYLLLKWQSENQDQLALNSAMSRQSKILSGNQQAQHAIQEFQDQKDLEKHKVQIYKDSQKHIGEKGPRKIQLKSKKSYKFAQNKIDVSVFDGVAPKALSSRKYPNEDQEKRKTLLAIEEESKDRQSFPDKFGSTKPSRSGLHKIDDLNESTLNDRTLQDMQQKPAGQHHQQQNNIGDNIPEPMSEQELDRLRELDQRATILQQQRELEEIEKKKQAQQLDDEDENYEDEDFHETLNKTDKAKQMQQNTNENESTVPKILQDQNRIRINEKEKQQKLEEEKNDQIEDNYE